MRKMLEVKDAQSCLNQCRADEMVFVLCGRDKAAPHAVREWIKQRIVLGLNKLEDDKIQEALRAAEIMEAER